MSEIEKLTKAVLAFRDERDWKQFHAPKDLAVGLMLEASEVLEHFQWKKDEEIQEYIKTAKEEIGDELADVLYYILLLADAADIDLVSAAEKKLKKNALKYPIEKAKGKAIKYNKL